MTVTLAQVEQATARKVGPYYQAYVDRQVPGTSNFEYVLVPSLRSTIEQDLVSNLWLLRRGGVDPLWRGYWNALTTYAPNDGVDWDARRWFTRRGIAGHSANLYPHLDTENWTEFVQSTVVPEVDRQRLVATYEPERGQVNVDRPWSTPPLPGEVLEFHHLNPELELREAVRAGLRRCLFEDRFNLGQGYIYEADLTSALPWLDDLNMVKRVQIGAYPNGYYGGGPSDVPYSVFGECGHVWVRVSGSGGPYYGGLLVTVHRPHYSWVNGEDVVEGPTQDTDCLNVDLEYAAAAAHIEAWHNFPAKLQAAAAGNLQATREQAALEFTRQSYVHRLPRHDHIGFEQSFGWGGRLVVVNA